MNISTKKFFNVGINAWFYIKLGVIFIIILSISGCLESSFEIGEESRIPSWFNISPELKRNELTVTLDYYTDGSAVFKLYKKGSYQVLDEVIGVVRDETPLERDGTSWPAGQLATYPVYVVVIFQGNAQIIEHKERGAVFYISDDLAIIKILGCSENIKNLYKCSNLPKSKRDMQ
jgi:hypothetical protein